MSLEADVDAPASGEDVRARGEAEPDRSSLAESMRTSLDGANLDGANLDSANRELARRASKGGVVYPALTLLLTVVSPWEDHLVPLIALAGFSVLGAVRLFWCRAFDTRYAVAPGRALGVLRAVFLVSAAGWGALAAHAVFAFGLSQDSFLALLFTAGIAAGATSSLMLDPRTHVAHLLLITLPLSAAVILRGGEGGIAVALSFAIYLAFLIRDARQAHATFVHVQQSEAERKFGDAELLRRAKELVMVHAELTRVHQLVLDESRSKSRLMARVSHEIRTPLNGLLGLSEVLSSAPLEPAHLEMVRSLRASAAALHQLVDDLLDVSRIQDGRVTLHVAPTVIRRLVGDILDTFGVLAERKGVAIAAIVDPDVPEQVSVDALRLRQVISNLVGNALKFTEVGEVTIRLGGEDLGGGVYRGCIEVEDTGPGIAEDALSGLFAEYAQAADEAAVNRQGTGLGLYISRELARALGGELVGTSQLGKGSIFSFTFESLFSREVSPTTSASHTVSASINLSSARVLVADPHEASRDALTGLAVAMGIDLVAVDDLASLVPLLGENGADIVIIEAELSDVDVVRRLSGLAPDAKMILARGVALLSEPVPAEYDAMTMKPYHASRLRSLMLDVLPDIDAISATSAERPNLRCLVVDDDSTNRMVARLLLERAGQTVVLAADTATAEAVLRGGDIDLVFQDVHMPTEDGLSFVKRLRRDFDQEPPIWIVAHSAATTPVERRSFVEAGMDDFLAKPIDVGLMTAALERADRAIRRRRRKSALRLRRPRV